MLRTALFLLAGLLFAPPSKPPADPLTLAVAVETAAGKVRLETGQAARPLPLATARLGEAVQARWFVQNRDRKRPYPQSVYHFFITRIDTPGQELPAEPKPGSLLDNSFAEELAAGGSTSGSCKLPVSEPGLYRVQFELLNQLAQRGQFCGVDLKVEAP
jgi:hypothetical protein